MTPEAPRETHIDIPGLSIAALEWGAADGEPVLGVHGWLDNAATLRPLGARLDEELHLVSIDFPGHGRSDHRAPGQSYYFADLVPVLFDIADALGWDAFSLLGHSMGAAAGFLAAGSAPDRIRTLTAIDSLGPWTTPAPDAPDQLQSGLTERKTLLDKSKRTFESFDAVLAAICEIYGLEPDQARPLVSRGTVERPDGDWELSYDLLLRGASLVRFTERQVHAFLDEITAPVLLLRPENGWPVDGDWAERRLDAVDHLQLETVPGGHHAHLQHPDLIGDFVTDFLQSYL